MILMDGRSRNASLIRTLCEPLSLGNGLVGLMLLAVLLAFPVAAVLNGITGIGIPSRTIAIILAPGHLVATLSTPNPRPMGDLFDLASSQPPFAFLVNLLYWFLILFGALCCIKGFGWLGRHETGASG
jgi:hypothetical protein